jgi:hypothetical protein
MNLEARMVMEGSGGDLFIDTDSCEGAEENRLVSMAGLPVIVRIGNHSMTKRVF